MKLALLKAKPLIKLAMMSLGPGLGLIVSSLVKNEENSANLMTFFLRGIGKEYTGL